MIHIPRQIMYSQYFKKMHCYQGIHHIDDGAEPMLYTLNTTQHENTIMSNNFKLNKV